MNEKQFIEERVSSFDSLLPINTTTQTAHILKGFLRGAIADAIEYGKKALLAEYGTCNVLKVNGEIYINIRIVEEEKEAEYRRGKQSAFNEVTRKFGISLEQIGETTSF